MNNDYLITQSQVNAINILLRVLQEAIQRKTFSEEEIENIYMMCDQLNRNKY
jgi:hypothetical protein